MDTSFTTFFSQNFIQLVVTGLLAVSAVWATSYYSWKDAVKVQKRFDDVMITLEQIVQNTQPYRTVINQTQITVNQNISQNVTQLVTNNQYNSLENLVRSTFSKEIANATTDKEREFLNALVAMFEQGWSSLKLIRDHNSKQFEIESNEFFTYYLSLLHLDYSDVNSIIDTSGNRWVIIDLDNGEFQILFQVPMRDTPRINLDFSQPTQIEAIRANRFGFKFRINPPDNIRFFRGYSADAEL